MTSLPPSIFLALRYLRPRRTFVSVITVISVLGVTLGVMVLILVISVMSGFDRELRQKVLGMNAHITITAGGAVDNWEGVMTQIEKRPHIQAVTPFAMGLVLLQFKERSHAPYLKGIDVERENHVTHLKEYLKEGTLNLENNQVVIGIELARRLGIAVGDKITIYSVKNFNKKSDVTYLPMEAEVSGIFESGMFEYDFNIILSSLETAQGLYDIGNKIHGMAIMTDNLETVKETQIDLNRILKFPLRASTWMDLNRRLFSAIAVEKAMMFFLLIFIIIVAAFGLMSTLITVVVQKRREIGILKSLGATPGNILTIFLTQGMIVGVIGTGLGLASGLLLLHYRNEFLEFLRRYTGFELFPREIYSFDLLPSQTNPSDIAIICISAFLICTFAGLFPAWRAAALRPAQVLRDL